MVVTFNKWRIRIQHGPSRTTTTNRAACCLTPNGGRWSVGALRRSIRAGTYAARKKNMRQKNKTMPAAAPTSPRGPVVELNLSDEDRDWRELGWDPDQMSRDTSGADEHACGARLTMTQATRSSRVFCRRLRPSLPRRRRPRARSARCLPKRAAPHLMKCAPSFKSLPQRRRPLCSSRARLRIRPSCPSRLHWRRPHRHASRQPARRLVTSRRPWQPRHLRATPRTRRRRSRARPSWCTQ